MDGSTAGGGCGTGPEDGAVPPARTPGAGGRGGAQEPGVAFDQLLAAALNGLTGFRTQWGGPVFGVAEQLQAIGRELRSPSGTGGPGAGPRLHLDGPRLSRGLLDWEPLLDRCAAVAYRAASPAFDPDYAAALHRLLRELDALGLATADPAAWLRLSLHLGEARLGAAGGAPGDGSWLGLLPLDGGAFVAVVDTRPDATGRRFTALFHDPAGRFDVPHPYTELSRGPVGEGRETGWLAEFLAEHAERGPAPWRPEAAEEFARLTGVTPTAARLVVAGMPHVDSHGRGFLPGEAQAAFGIKAAHAAHAAVARDELRKLDHGVRREIVAALLPGRPAALWTDGPDAAAAARVWNARVGRRPAVPEGLVSEAVRAVRTAWEPARALPALLDPAGAPELSADLRWKAVGGHVVPADEHAAGFTRHTLVGAVALTAWLAHRLPAGDPVRAALPAALAAVRERLAAPGAALSLGCHFNRTAFRDAAGAPAETGDGWERHGALVMPTQGGDWVVPAIRVDLLDALGASHLSVLRTMGGGSWELLPEAMALRLARDPRLEALLAEPGDPAAGERAADGTWWPQDPARSVPELVAEAAEENGLGRDAAALYLALLAMPDPTDRNVARWTGWKPARFKAARAELAGTGLVVEERRVRAGRSLFLPGDWADPGAPQHPKAHLPLEEWKLPLLDLVRNRTAQLSVIVPAEPAAALYARAWRRVRDGDRPR
ncbi:hypothetical protein [Planomonospora venezuelensis]|uniref:DNA-binding protein n=1 Tax=Planomonospora venezuelensis TaxID=1999 RepID=A0A841DAA0_PLAVE|nr:hypothetical protein [Planomonospora venezuelensis]MBB5965597.1 hypothetical protein [Planomonospora venezuelensis]GIN05205.1 hypothetical protein Pve01_68630 [Planomonospora venezuelensis]